MRCLAALLVLCFALPVSAGNFVRSYVVSFDLYIDEANPTTNYASADPLLIEQGSGVRKALIIARLATDALAEGEALDSAYVVAWPTGSPLDTLTVSVREILRTVTNLATWNIYAGGQNWQVPGALGALDVDLSTDYGYGGNGMLYELIRPTGSSPESLLIARGTGFSGWVEGKLGGAVRLIWHPDAAGDLAGIPLQNGTARLRIWGHTGGPRRRVLLQE